MQKQLIKYLVYYLLLIYVMVFGATHQHNSHAISHPLLLSLVLRGPTVSRHVISFWDSQFRSEFTHLSTNRILSARQLNKYMRIYIYIYIVQRVHIKYVATSRRSSAVEIQITRSTMYSDGDKATLLETLYGI